MFPKSVQPTPPASKRVITLGKCVCKVTNPREVADIVDAPRRGRPNCLSQYRACISGCSSTPLFETPTPAVVLPPTPTLFTTIPTTTAVSICGTTQFQCGSACCDIPRGPGGGGQFCASPELSLCCSTFSWGLCGNECCSTPCCGTVCCPSGTVCASFGNCVKIGSPEECKVRRGSTGQTCTVQPGCWCVNGCCMSPIVN
jgi:hypothetical protein